MHFNGRGIETQQADARHMPRIALTVIAKRVLDEEIVEGQPVLRGLVEDHPGARQPDGHDLAEAERHLLP